MSAVTVRGLKEAQDRLRKLSTLARRDVALPLLMAAAQPIATAWASRIRRKSGQTAGAIKVRVPKQAAGDKVQVVVNAAYRAHVARLLEYGYIRKNKRTGTVSHIPRYPSAQPAFDSTQDQVKANLELAIIKAALS